MSTSQNDDQGSIEANNKETGLVRRSEFLAERVRQLAQQVRALGAVDYFLRGESNFYRRQNQQAIQDFSETIRLAPTWAAAYRYRALARTRLNQFEQAIQDWDQVIRLDPTRAAYGGKGLAHSFLEQYEQAIQAYDQAIKLDPTDPHYYEARGRQHKRLGDFEQAERDLQKAKELGYTS